MSIILSCDSTCDLNLEIERRYNVKSIPYHIILDGYDYKDNVDITADDIYKVFKEKKILPKTSAVNVGEYMDFFRQWVEEGHEVIHFCLGSSLSSSYQNCVIAAEELGNVYPIDACNLSSAIALQIMDCGDLINKGLEVKEIYDIMKNSLQKYHASFVLNSLDFLSAGGRCSSLVAFGTNLLNIKVGIEVDNTNGSMGVGKKYRGSMESALKKYVKDKLEEYNDIRLDRICITHSGIDDYLIKVVREEINKYKEFKEVFITRASCTISSHCGPSTLGILFATEN